MPVRPFICAALAAAFVGASTAPAFAQSPPAPEAKPAPAQSAGKGALPKLAGFTRTVEKGVAVYRGRAPVKKAHATKKGPCRCDSVIRVQTTIKLIDRYPPTHLRTQGFFSGKGRRSRSFTHGFYSGRR